MNLRSNCFRIRLNKKETNTLVNFLWLFFFNQQFGRKKIITVTVTIISWAQMFCLITEMFSITTTHVIAAINDDYIRFHVSQF